MPSLALDRSNARRQFGRWPLFLLLGTLIAIGAAAWYFGAAQGTQDPHGRWLFLAIAMAVLGAGGLVVVRQRKARSMGLPVHLSFPDPVKGHAVRRDEILGWRPVAAGNGELFVELVPRDPKGRTLRIPQNLQNHPVFQKWMATLPRLDSGLPGAIPTATLHAESNGRTLARWLNIAGIAVSLWGALVPRPYAVVVLALAAMPWLTLAMAARSRGLLRISQQRNDPHPNLAAGFLLPGLALVMRAITDYQVFDWTRVLLPALALAFCVCLAAMAADRSLRLLGGTNALILSFTLAYGMGAALGVNRVLDSPRADVFRAVITAKQIVRGSRSTSYELTLTAWGPRTQPSRIDVARRLYRAVTSGDTVCVELHPGRLGIRWYTVEQCREF